MTDRRAIVLFTGDPQREAARKGLPARFLGALHRQLIETLEHSANADLIVAADGGGAFTLHSASSGTTRAFAETLAEKVATALNHVRTLGYDSIVLLAGDVAGLELSSVHQAFEDLAGTGPRCVVGRSGDGGFYLLGLNAAAAADERLQWSALPWFTDRCAVVLCDRALGLGWQISFANELDDIDCIADATRIVSRLTTPAFRRLRRVLVSLLTQRPGRFAVPAGVFFTARSTAALRGPPAC